MRASYSVVSVFLLLPFAACGQNAGNAEPAHDASVPTQDSAADDVVTDVLAADSGDDVVTDSGMDSGTDAEWDADGHMGDAGVDVAEGGDGFTADSSPEGGQDGGDTCALYTAGVQVGNINNFLLYELSGITSSQQNSGVLWTHNDGAGAEFYAIAVDSTFLGTYSLTDLITHDWEDIGVGPGPEPGRSYVYVGDHGNNGRDRQRVWVHRIPEPTLAAAPPFNLNVSGGETIPLDYPSERHDVETLLVDPVTSDVYLVTKAYEGPTILFRAAAPLTDGQAVTLEQMNTMDLGSRPNFDLAKGGDVSPAGDRIVVRTTVNAFVWNRPPGTPFWEAFDGVPCVVPLQLELTGEAIGFAADGVSFYTTSEWLNPPLYYYRNGP